MDSLQDNAKESGALAIGAPPCSAITVEDVDRVATMGWYLGNGHEPPDVMELVRQRDQSLRLFGRSKMHLPGHFLPHARLCLRLRSQQWRHLGFGNRARRRMIALMGYPQPPGSTYGGRGKMHWCHTADWLRANSPNL